MSAQTQPTRDDIRAWLATPARVCAPAEATSPMAPIGAALHGRSPRYTLYHSALYERWFIIDTLRPLPLIGAITYEPYSRVVRRPPSQLGTALHGAYTYRHDARRDCDCLNNQHRYSPLQLRIDMAAAINDALDAIGA